MSSLLVKKRNLGNSSRNTILENCRGQLSSVKSLTYRKFNKSGRNNVGRITVKHRGGGNKIRIRRVDHGFDKHNEEYGISYDSNRTGKIILAKKESGELIYRTKLDDYNVYQLKDLPINSFICNFEIFPNSKSKLCRSPGATAKIVSKIENNYVHVKLPSGELRKVHENCRSYVGTIPHGELKYIKVGNAGRNRRLNIRPTNRGVAMKCYDHCNGGENGKNKGKLSRTAKGILAVGGRTRIRPSKFTIINSRGKKIKR